MKTRINILPGGELADVVENKLGAARHQLVENLRQEREGEWAAVRGHIYYFDPSAADVREAVEVTDDQSGDRFILYQDGTALKRADWDEDDGYIGATPSTLSLPAGITIGADVFCKMFVNRGVVRITGPGDGTKGVPLWYGYIDRTLFPDAWREVYLGCFETDIEGWTGNVATLSQYDCDADGDTTGMWGAPEKVNALKVFRTGAAGHAWKTFTVGLGKTVRVLLMAFKKTDATGDIQVHIGKSTPTEIATVSVYDGGNGYQVGDVLTLEQPTGGIAATCTVDTITGTGGLISVLLLDHGTGYTPGPVVLTVVQAGASLGTLNCTVDAGGQIVSIDSIASGGSGYHPDWPMATTGGGNNDCTIQILVTTGEVATVSLTTAGNGYMPGTSTTTSAPGYGCVIEVLTVDFVSTYDYDTLTTTTRDDWVMLESEEFVTTGTELRVTLVSGTGSAAIAYFDFILIEENAKIVIDGWKLEKAQLTPFDVDVEALDQLCSKDESDVELTRRGLFGKSFFTYDEAQCSLPKTMPRSASRNTLPEVSLNNVFSDMDGEIGYGRFAKMGVDFRIMGSNLATSFLNNRITGMGVAVGTIEGGNPLIASSVPYYISKDLNIADELDPVNYVSDYLHRQNDTATYPNNLWRGLSYRYSHFYPEDLSMKVGRRIKISTEDGTLDTVITEIVEAQQAFSVAHPVAVLGGGTPDGSGYIKLDNALINIENIWNYDSALGYLATITFDAMALTASAEMYDYLDIPAGTTENTPDYDQHVVAGARAFVISNEAEEEDIIRYSPEDQPDNFPNLNIEPIASGDNDRAVWIGNRDERLVVLKRKSISQISFYGDQFSSDIKLALNGLFTGRRGAISQEGVVYFMDQGDLFVFDGNRMTPLMQTEGQRKKYRENLGADSFILWDKLNSELQVHLTTGNILVWHPERKEWYERTRPSNVDYVGGFLDADNKLVIWNAKKTSPAISSKFYTQNHDETVFDEALGFSVTTSLLDGENPERFKQIEKAMVQGVSNGALTFGITDPNDARVFSETLTLPVATATTAVVETYPDYLFREAEITIACAPATTTSAKIKRISLEVTAW